VKVYCFHFLLFSNLFDTFNAFPQLLFSHVYWFPPLPSETVDRGFSVLVSYTQCHYVILCVSYMEVVVNNCGF
jgi:hypothetical protein